MKLIGNANIIGQINIAILAAREQNRPIPHMLLSGAAGCGKTSTARYIAELTGSDLIMASADSVKSREDVLSIIGQMNHRGYDKYGRKISTTQPSIVFIDEVHNVPISGQEHMGIVMEEWYLPVTKREANVDAKNVKNRDNAIRWSPEFTLIGATTNDGDLSKPFRDRFKLRFLFSTYSLDDSMLIAKEHAMHLDIILDDNNAAMEIAKRGRGVPRTIVSLLERCRDTALACKDDPGSWKDVDMVEVNHAITVVTFDNLGIDKTGLTKTDINILKALYESVDAVGLDNLAVLLNESTKVLSEAVEPYLIQRGLIIRTGKGRKITDKGLQYLMENGYIKFEMNKKYDIPRNFDRGL
ncbi:MAG: AAA family ATPase [Deltaproteobacteria bacterium]|nr:AAA family ATPase [Deltaproteobacteria bacterium]